MSRRPNNGTARPARRGLSRRPNLEILEVRELLTGFVVTSVADNGNNMLPMAGSLRAAIVAANSDTSIGGYSITFNLASSGVQTIAVPTSLPAITRASLVIDGDSEPGFLPAKTPLVVIDGSIAGAGASGLTFTTGTGDVVRGLSIVGFASNNGAGGAAIDLQASSGSESIQGNYIGIEPDGSTAKANYYGIVDFSSSNTIGGSVASAGNVISGNTTSGVFLLGGASGNLVIGNLIGTNAVGSAGLGNFDGVILAASGNTIGGTTSGTGNLISGNDGTNSNPLGIGILFEGESTANVVQGNQIGTDINGATAVGNSYGIYFGTPGNPTNPNDNVSQDTIGGTVSGAGNLISGNFLGITGNVTAALIAGNTIGLNASGSAPVPNGDGILLGANASTIGGTTAASRNVVSGNNASVGVDGTGIDLSGNDDLVIGNYIGLIKTGVGANSGNAVGLALNVNGSTIGGTTPGSGNVIAGNTSNGITLTGSGLVSFFGNVIGLNAQGASLPNLGDGLLLTIPAPAQPTTTPIVLNDIIGGTTSGAGNTIATNGGGGIVVNSNSPSGYTGLSVRGNSIFGNTGLGIDLNDSDISQPSTLFVTATGIINGQLEVVGVIYGKAATNYAIDLFANGADGTGYGQGAIFLGTVTVTTNLSGFALFTPSFTPPSTPYTSFTATSTGPDGNTSEFSANFPTGASVPRADLTVVTQTAKSSVIVGDKVTFTETIINNGSSAANNVSITDTLPTSLVNTTVVTSAGSGSFDNNNVLVANLGTLASGQSATVTITGNVTQAGLVFDSPGVSSTTFDPNYSNNQAQESITVQPAGTGPTADLAITEVASPTSAKVGTNLTYVVTVINHGPYTATNATVNDFLPANVTLVSAVPSQGSSPSVNGTFLSDNLGTILSGGSATFTIVVTPRVAGSIVNAANVSGNQFDPVSANNSTSLTTPVASAIPNIGMVISQTASSSPGLLGQTQMFVIRVANLGTDPLTNATLVDTLPANVTVISASPSQGGTAFFVNGFVVENLGTIAPGGSATLTLLVMPKGPGLLVNGAGVYTPDVPSAGAVYSNNGVISIPSGPSVIGVVGHAGNSSLIFTFDVPLNSYTATTKANYKITALGKNGQGPGKSVAIIGASYNAANNTVTITPSAKLDPTQYYQIQVIGSTSSGVTDIYGRRLTNPQYSTPGADFSALIFAGTFPQG